MFLNAIMLAGLGGAVVPLVLHLLSRARYQEVEWGAMMFLQGAQARQRLSARAAQYLLLLLRMATVGLLAAALARPVVHGKAAQDALGGQIVATLLLDCSPSMGYEENGRTRFQMAQAAARQILRGLQPGDRVSLVLMGAGQTPADLEPTADLRSIETRIDEAKIAYSRADLHDALIRAADVLERYDKSSRDIYVICDRQALSWNQITPAFAQDWRKQIDGTATPKNAAARMFVLPVGGTEADNLAVESVRLLNPPAIFYRRADGHPAPIEVEVTVHNYGNVPRIGQPLSIIINGARTAATKTINVGTNQFVTTTLPVEFDRTGSYVLSAKVSATGYTGDDHLETIVDVVEPVRVLVISSEDRAEGGRGSADYVTWALAPHAAAGMKDADPFVVTSLSADHWADVDLERFGVVVLANVERFSAAQARRLERYVYGGGKLLVAPGSLSRYSDYNSTLYREGGGILPAQLEAPTPPDGSQATTLLSWDANHPIFQFLRGQYEAPAATVMRYFPAKPRQVDATPLAWYLSGDPFLIEGRSERGRVLLMTTSLDADWTTMPLSSFYLPFVQSSIRYLAGVGAAGGSLLPGQPIRLPIDETGPPPAVTLTHPDGHSEALEVLRLPPQAEVRYANTEQPGEYQIRITRPGSAPISRVFIVRPPRDESDLTQLTDERWKQLQTMLHFQLLDPTVRPIRDSLAIGRGGRELWAYLLAAVFALMIAEMLVTRMWSTPGASKRRPSQSTSDAILPEIEQQEGHHLGTRNTYEPTGVSRK